MTPLWLGLIGIALTLPVPAILARARWQYRSPTASIIMWQALALAAILATSGAGLSTALWLVSPEEPSPWRVALHLLVLLVGMMVWARFWWAVWTVWRSTESRRRRQRELLDLVGEPEESWEALRILQHETPIAYCIPNRTQARVVVSSGAINALASDELEAVIQHERAHVSARHDLVLEGFEFLRAAYPRVLRTDAPLEQSRVLIELLADDSARKVVDAKSLARAIVALTGSHAPIGTLGVAGSELVRLQRITDPPTRWWAAALAYGISAFVLIVPTVFLAIPWIVHATGVLLR